FLIGISIDGPMCFMAAELRAQRAPANIMLHLVRQRAEREAQFAQVGGNDPCSCGSGRKFKHCCGRRGR
ncbi:MAG: SEC-C domain-containing protein, partial [Anaerolineae bacterium]|nr:SEC-C domain-containing protein [Anaerolineae bacterium]